MQTKPSTISRTLSTFLTFFLFIQLIAVIFLFVPKPQIARAVTTLTNVTDTPTSTKISTSTSHKIDFTTYTTVPSDGKIVITFPAGFNVASAAFSAWSGFDGNKTVSVSGQVVTVTRTTGGTASTAGGKYIILSGITNTATIETNYTVTVETQNSAAATLDGPTTSYYFSICANACHTATYQIPWSSTVSVSGKHTTQFTTASAIPADGKIKLTFPAGFDISGATFDSWSDFDGGESLVINGQVITITRDNIGTSKAAGAKYIILNNIINNSTAGSAYYATLETLTTADVNIEGPTSIRFTINSAGLGLASSPWPSRDGSLGKTHNTGVAGPIYPTMKWASNFGYTLTTAALDWWYKGQILFWAIAPNGTIYAEVKEEGGTARLIALDNSGNVQWSYPVTTRNLSAISIAQDGAIYTAKDISALQGRIALNSDGSVKWLTAGEGARYLQTPNILPDGSIYFSGNFGTIFSPDGLAKTDIYTMSGGLIPGTWYYSNLPQAHSWDFNITPVIGSDGTIYKGFHSNVLAAYNPDFTLEWSLSLPSGSSAYSITLDTDGTIYFIDNGTTNKILYALNSDSSTKWQYTLPDISANPDASIAISDQSIYVACATKLYIFDKSGNLVLTKDGFNGSIPVISSNGMIYSQQNTTNYLQASDTSGNFKWHYKSAVTAQYNNGLMLPGYNQEIYTYDITNKKAVAFQPWTVSLALNRSDYYNPGDTISFTATTSMLTTDPVTAEANQAQVYLSDGTIVPLTYASTNSAGNTIWTGTYTISSGKPDGAYTATFEASAVNVETDTTVHFASAPTNTNNTGITSAISYTVKKQSASAPSLDAPRPSDLPNSSEPVLADADQKPTPPKASKYNPSGGFDLLLNGGAKTTPNPEVSLYLFGGPDTKYMQISEDPTFKGAVQEKYTPHKHWQLKDNKLGKHTIYIRYFTLYDVPSETVSQSILLTKTTPPDSPPSQATTPSVPSCTTTIIKTGDTLWDLAAHYFNQGSLYPNLINLNKNTYSSLVTNPGYLRLGWEIKVECK